MLSQPQIETDIVWLENSIIFAERQMASRLRQHIAEQEALIERMRQSSKIIRDPCVMPKHMLY